MFVYSTQRLLPSSSNAAFATITLDADADIDMFLRLGDGTCLAGYDGCAISMGTGRHSGMDYYFSGDDLTEPVRESIELTSKSTVWTYFFASSRLCSAFASSVAAACVNLLYSTDPN